MVSRSNGVDVSCAGHPAMAVTRDLTGSGQLFPALLGLVRAVGCVLLITLAAVLGSAAPSPAMPAPAPPSAVNVHAGVRHAPLITSDVTRQCPTLPRHRPQRNAQHKHPGAT